MVAILEGRLDTTAAPETEKALNVFSDFAGQNIIIDCTRLEYISSSGLRIFLKTLKTAHDKGGHVYIKDINDEVRAIFALTGFDNIFEFI